MRFLGIVLFVFCLHVSIALVNSTGVFYSEVQAKSDWFIEIDDDSLADESYVQSQLGTTTDSYGVGDFVKGLWYFVKAFGWGIIAVPYSLGMFGLKAPFTYLVSLPVYLLYFLAIAQWISNRGTRNMS